MEKALEEIEKQNEEMNEQLEQSMERMRSAKIEMQEVRTREGLYSEEEYEKKWQAAREKMLSAKIPSEKIEAYREKMESLSVAIESVQPKLVEEYRKSSEWGRDYREKKFGQEDYEKMQRERDAALIGVPEMKEFEKLEQEIGE